MSDTYVTLRCKAERHELCRTHAETRCACDCHWTLFPDRQPPDAAARLDLIYQPLCTMLAAYRESAHE